MRAIDIISTIIILSLSIWSWGGNAQEPHRYTGFRLNLQWPAAFCKVNPGKCIKPPLPDTFTIHGLWPYNKAGNPIVSCSGSAFDVRSINAPLREDMDALWPTINRDFASNPAFWKYQWEKHGVCSESVDFTQTDYFKKAIDLTNGAGVLGALKNEGITPDDEKTYLGSTIIAAIKKKLNAKPELVCPREPTSNKPVLLEIKLCVNKPATAFQDCPLPASANCVNANLKFIPLPPPPPPPSVSLYTPI